MSGLTTRLQQAAAALRAALEPLKAELKLQVPPDVGPGVDPPAVIVGAPKVNWEGTCAPTSATFRVYLVVTLDEVSLDRLLALLEPVAAALDSAVGACVMTADPATYPLGDAGDVPAYEIQVDVAL